MAIQQTRPLRKVSGGRYKGYRKKKKYELGGIATLTRIGNRKVKNLKARGGNGKIITLTNDVVNLYDNKTKKYSKAKLKSVVENPANRHYVRRNILTKGTIVDTEKGKAKITNRPGQEGTVNAVLL